ncbi:hypothetical protein ACFRCM_25035, partial [Streptomyces halstedii]
MLETTRPTKLGRPFTRWSIHKLARHLRRSIARPVRIGREALRCLLARRGVTFQRTKTWKESSDPDFDAKLDRPAGCQPPPRRHRPALGRAA